MVHFEKISREVPHVRYGKRIPFAPAAGAENSSHQQKRMVQGCKDGRYPKPIKLGTRTTVWKASDIAEEDEKLTRQAATAGISVARTGKRSILDSDGLEGFQASFYGLTHPPDFENRMLKILQYRVWRVWRDF